MPTNRTTYLHFNLLTILNLETAISYISDHPNFRTNSLYRQLFVEFSKTIIVSRKLINLSFVILPEYQGGFNLLEYSTKNNTISNYDKVHPWKLISDYPTTNNLSYKNFNIQVDNIQLLVT